MCPGWLSSELWWWLWCVHNVHMMLVLCLLIPQTPAWLMKMSPWLLHQLKRVNWVTSFWKCQGVSRGRYDSRGQTTGSQSLTTISNTLHMPAGPGWLVDSTGGRNMKHCQQLRSSLRELVVSVCILSDVMSNSPSSNVNCGLVVLINNMRAEYSITPVDQNTHCFELASQLIYGMSVTGTWMKSPVLQLLTCDYYRIATVL